MSNTDFKVSLLDKQRADRVIVTITDAAMKKYLEDNPRFVYSLKTDKPIRLLPEKPIDAELLPEVARLLLRCHDEISDSKRSKGQIASVAQISRARQLATILDKRKDNVFFLPDGIEKMSWTEVGRLIHDYKVILAVDGLWDNKNKVEIEK